MHLQAGREMVRPSRPRHPRQEHPSQPRIQARASRGSGASRWLRASGCGKVFAENPQPMVRHEVAYPRRGLSANTFPGSPW